MFNLVGRCMDVFDRHRGRRISIRLRRKHLHVNMETVGEYVDDIVETWPHGLLIILGALRSPFEKVL